MNNNFELFLLGDLELATLSDLGLKESWERLEEYIAEGHLCHLLHLLLVQCPALFDLLSSLHVDVRLHIGVMAIGEDAYGVFLEFGDASVAQALVDLPEVLIVVPPQALNQALLIARLHREDVVGAAETKGMRLLQVVDEVETQEVKSFQLQTLLLLVSLVVEGQAPRQVPLLVLDAHHCIKLNANRHIPTEWILVIKCLWLPSECLVIELKIHFIVGFDLV